MRTVNHRVGCRRCGSGYTTCVIGQEYGCQVTGVDLSEYMIGEAKKRAESLELYNVKFEATDACDLPFENDYFDAIISEPVTVFLPDKKQAIREYIRVIRPGGWLGNSKAYLMPNIPVEATTEIHEVSKNLIGSWVIYPTKEEWRSIFEESGVQKLQIFELSRDMISGKTPIQDVGVKNTLRIVFKAYWQMMINRKVRKTMLEFSKLEGLGKYLGYLIIVEGYLK